MAYDADKPTPGPWYCLTNRAPGQKQDHIVRSKPGRCEVARASEQFMARGERIANARLIAAAPDMLETLHKLANGMGAECWMDDYISKAQALAIIREAIAKAHGLI